MKTDDSPDVVREFFAVTFFSAAPLKHGQKRV
jgi:hypothetical protein